MTWIEAVAVAFGIVSVYLSTRENVWSWPTALVNVSLYVLIFRNARLYADMGLQVFYIAISFYGWWNWLYGGAGRTELRVSRISPRLAAALPVAGALFAWGLGRFLDRATDASLPYLDASLTTASLAAQWLMTRKVLENWVIWMVADVVYVGMFIFKELYLTAGLYAVFLVLATMGFVQWRRSWREHAAEATPAPPAPHPAPSA